MNDYVHRMAKRAYTLKNRAESREATHRRIVDATVRLHETLGPKHTTISAIAEEAGVQRLTVYRHFPDEAALFQGCSSAWRERNPQPDPELWASVSDGLERSSVALKALYRYYEGTAAMWTALYRDLAEVDVLKPSMNRFAAYLEGVADDLVRHIAPSRDNPELAATLRHAVQFSTWRSLAAIGLDETAKAELVIGWLTGILGGRGRKAGRSSGQAALIDIGAE
jgi:AcrR family transcriptional regulator